MFTSNHIKNNKPSSPLSQSPTSFYTNFTNSNTSKTTIIPQTKHFTYSTTTTTTTTTPPPLLPTTTTKGFSYNNINNNNNSNKINNNFESEFNKNFKYENKLTNKNLCKQYFYINFLKYKNK